MQHQRRRSQVNRNCQRFAVALKLTLKSYSTVIKGASLWQHATPRVVKLRLRIIELSRLPQDTLRVESVERVPTRHQWKRHQNVCGRVVRFAEQVELSLQLDVDPHVSAALATDEREVVVGTEVMQLRDCQIISV